MQRVAILALADGSVFRGRAIGADGMRCGELVFNTSMTGYQEILTDPSYDQQIVTLTYPHIGNTGVNTLDVESSKTHAAGLVVRDVPELYSSWRAEQSLPDYLRDNNIIGIADIDTRELTRRLRTHGTQNACLMAGDEIDENEAIAAAKAHPSMSGQDLASGVSVKEQQPWSGESIWQIDSNAYAKQQDAHWHVLAYDFGTKSNIFRLLAEHGCRVTIVPAHTTAEEALALNPDGIFLSNGPGDPEPLTDIVATIQTFIEHKIPTFGICLGHQLLGLACGAKTLKMNHGHHGANHPVQDLDSKQVMITSQNHGFAVDEATLPENVRATHRSLFDGTLQGLAYTDAPAFGFQGHPEASAGPRDSEPLFTRFIDAMKQASK
ncbi:glutamine-hydrolyzing carbamoyl-phosphate synthase small subunit [Suttonella sp. R2A3]|uniref:glutamine-hydrolyzing carbamoyl-phosphate synthase small subunit n=1 Tax=Suttonella sp. R2A3 TaxID=2908648 RepID=UPI001F2D5A62|nr:glutamine-hydrolyzing carbamoyl-phosphate synthase small subunit [Suttonella sp. R2A3]UJF24151.1 glutamine-hydrolyzing carbamoyl-phosphate synthase small subunit [Suttonella sp. R2A3]